MTFYLQQQVLNTRRQALLPLIATIIGTGAQITLSLYFLRGFGPEPIVNATDLPLGNESSYLGAAISRSSGSYISAIITGIPSPSVVDFVDHNNKLLCVQSDGADCRGLLDIHP